MKYLLLVNLFFTLPLFSKGQNLDALDKKMGFNKFKLGSTFNDYASDLKYVFSGPNNDKYYRYNKKDIKQLFDSKIKEIDLGFYKNKLYTISIFFEIITEDESKNILAKLMELFGIPKKADAEASTSYDWQFHWDGNKVFMAFSKYSCLFKGDQACEDELFINSKDIQTKITTDQF